METREPHTVRHRIRHKRPIIYRVRATRVSRAVHLEAAEEVQTLSLARHRAAVQALDHALITGWCCPPSPILGGRVQAQLCHCSPFPPAGGRSLPKAVLVFAPQTLRAAGREAEASILKLRGYRYRSASSLGDPPRRLLLTARRDACSCRCTLRVR